MKKISIFLICSLLMIFGLSFSACADAVTTGGVTATAVAPRAVDSSGNIIDVSENINHVEHTAFAKANATTTETTTTKPAYNQEEMKKDLEDLGKEDMAASAVGIFAWVKGLVDWTQGIINTLGIYIKAGIDSPWGFDLNGFVDLFAPFFKTIGYGILVLLFGINLIHSAMQFELVNYKGVIKILVGLLLAKLWVDLSTDICIAIIDTCTDIASSVFTSADEMIVFPSFDTLKSTDTGLWIIGELLNQLLDIVLLAPIIIVALLSIDISDMGEQLRPVGLQVILEYIWQRVRDNRTKGVQTWVWVDEFSIMFNDGNDKETVRSADFFQKVFKRIRKYGGIPTGITQNITEVLESGQARLMLSNSEFVVLLQQKKTDLDKVIELFNLSPSQSSYLKTGEKGTGLIVSGKKIIPFDRRISKDSSIYNLCQTDFRRDVT